MPIRRSRDRDSPARGPDWQCLAPLSVPVSYFAVMPPIAEEHPETGDQNGEESDGSWVNAELLQEALEEGATILQVDVQRAVGKGDNFLSVLYRAHVEYKTAESDDVKVKNLIVKGLPPGEFMLTFIEEVGFFRREASIYYDLLPHLYDFADQKLGKGSYNKFSAGYHKCSRPDTVILEDLRPEGFVMASRRDRLDLAHSKLVVQNLARLHALSLAFEEKHPGVISQYDDRMFSEHNRERLLQFMPPQLKSVVDEIRKWKGFGDIAKKLEMLGSDTRIVDKLLDTTRPLEGGRRVLVHGDCWVNNILFKYSEAQQAVNMRFVDFQITREASPALDLNYFLFSSVKTEIRVRHMDDLLHEYCEEFERCAKELGFSGPLITFEEITKEVERTLYFGFTSVLTTMAVVLADPEDSPDLSALTEEQVKKGEKVNIFEKVYASAAFREAFGNLLPYFDERRVFD